MCDYMMIPPPLSVPAHWQRPSIAIGIGRISISIGIGVSISIPGIGRGIGGGISRRIGGCYSGGFSRSLLPSVVTISVGMSIISISVSSISIGISIVSIPGAGIS